MSNYDFIQAALDQKLNTWATLNVAWPNYDFTPTKGVPYLKADFLPSPSVSAGLGSSHNLWLTGIYQVLVKYPVGAGSGEARRKADDVVTLFKSGTLATYSTITVDIRRAHPDPPLDPTEDWFTIPVTIEWEVYAPNA